MFATSYNMHIHSMQIKTYKMRIPWPAAETFWATKIQARYIPYIALVTYLCSLVQI